MLKLLMSPASPFVRKVRVLTREAGRENEVEEVRVQTTALATDPAILPFNPTGRIPVLVREDGPAILDSRVICRFLDARFQAGLYPEARIWEVLTLEALADGSAERVDRRVVRDDDEDVVMELGGDRAGHRFLLFASPAKAGAE